MRLGWFIAAIFLATPTSIASAAPAPTNLRGKSIVVTWSESRVQRRGGEENFRSMLIQHELRAYVSDAGRVFSRQTNSIRGRSGSQDDVSGGRDSNRVPQFSGQSMIMTMAGGSSSVARRIVVSFSGDFTNCEAKVARANEKGVGTTIGRSMISGAAIEVKSASVSSASCSVQRGNVFGGE